MERLQSLELRLEARNKLAQLKNDMLVLKNICEPRRPPALAQPINALLPARVECSTPPALAIGMPRATTLHAIPPMHASQGSPSCATPTTMRSGWRASMAARHTHVRAGPARGPS